MHLRWARRSSKRVTLLERILIERAAVLATDIAEPEDVMHAVLLFVSPASDFITGQTLYVDGGITAMQ